MNKLLLIKTTEGKILYRGEAQPNETIAEHLDKWLNNGHRYYQADPYVLVSFYEYPLYNEATLKRYVKNTKR